MEEKKTNLVEAIDALCKRYNMSDGVRTDFMLELKEIIKDQEKCDLKPFNLEAAKAGKPVYSRDGRKARIICFDAKGKQPIIALFEREKADEVIIQTYNIDGSYYGLGKKDNRDLMMLHEKKEVWVNIYDDMVMYESEEEAKLGIATKRNYIATAKVELEE